MPCMICANPFSPPNSSGWPSTVPENIALTRCAAGAIAEDADAVVEDVAVGLADRGRGRREGAFDRDVARLPRRAAFDLVTGRRFRG